MPTATTTTTAPAPHLVRVGAATIPAQAEPPALETINAAAPAVPLPVRDTAAPAAPVLRVVRGTATAEEVAAVTAVLLARATAVRSAADADDALTSRRAAASWRMNGFCGPRAWTTDARDLLAG